MSHSPSPHAKAPRFSLSLDDEAQPDRPEPPPSGDEIDSLPPIDFPQIAAEVTPRGARPQVERARAGLTATGASASESAGAEGDSRPDSPETNPLLEQIRQQLRFGRAEGQSPAATAAPTPRSTPSASRAPQIGGIAPSRRPPASSSSRQPDRPVGEGPKKGRAWLGPLVMILGAGLAYVASTTSLGMLAPTLSSRSPRVPDLGTLGPQPRATTPGQAAPTAARQPAPGQPAEGATAIETVALPEAGSYPGRGLLEVVTTERELVYVDGIFIGRGPLRRIPLQPGKHAILIRSGGHHRTSEAKVQVGQGTRVHFETAVVLAPSPELTDNDEDASEPP